MTRSISPLILAAAILAQGTMLMAQPPDVVAKYTAAVWKDPDGGKLNYRHRAPDKVEAGKKYPLVLLLHGAGGRGDDNRGQIVDAGGGLALEKAGISSKHGAYVIAGQVPKGKMWVDVPWSTLDHEMPKVSDPMHMMLAALDAFVADEKNQVDRNRIYVIGLSMGGYGTWDAIQRRPDTFAAAVPICGGGDKRQAKKIAKLPVWAWHGDQDGVIKPSRSRDMVAALKAAGGKPKYTEVKGRGHNVWVDAFGSKEMWEWLFEQQRKPKDVSGVIEKMKSLSMLTEPLTQQAVWNHFGDAVGEDTGSGSADAFSKSESYKVDGGWVVWFHYCLNNEKRKYFLCEVQLVRAEKPKTYYYFWDDKEGFSGPGD